jgi:hypothetical protein
MPHVISVRPCATGWAVLRDAKGEQSIHPTAGEAEREARRLGEQLSARGEAAEIRYHLKDGRLAARFLCPAMTLEWA